MSTNELRLLELKAMAFDLIRDREQLQQQANERSSQLAAVAQAIAQLEAEVHSPKAIETQEDRCQTSQTSASA